MSTTSQWAACLCEREPPTRPVPRSFSSASPLIRELLARPRPLLRALICLLYALPSRCTAPATAWTPVFITHLPRSRPLIVMPALSSVLACAMPSSSPVEAPVPPGGHCGSAPPDLSDHQSNPLYLPRFILFKPDLAPLIDATVQEKVRKAEEKKIAAGETVDVVSEGTASQFARLLDDFAMPLPFYIESSVDQAMQFLLRAVIALVNPLYALFDLPSPPRHFVQPKLLLPPTDSHGKQHNLKLEIDLSIQRFVAATADTGLHTTAPQPAQSWRHRFLSCLTIRTPDASRPATAARTASGAGEEGIYRQLIRCMRQSPCLSPQQVNSQVTDFAASSCLLQAIQGARLAGVTSFVLVDGLSFVIGELVDLESGGFDVFLSGLHPIASTDPTQPSLLRILLRSILPEQLGVASLHGDDLAGAAFDEDRQALLVEAVGEDRNLSSSSSEGDVSIARKAGVPDHQDLQSARSERWLLTCTYPDGVSLVGRSLSAVSTTSSAESTTSCDSRPATPAATSPFSVSPDYYNSPIALVSLVGRGAVGHVYRGTDSVGNAVAVKIARPGMEDYLRDEALLGRDLRAYNEDVLTFEGLFERHDGRLFAVMQDGGEAPEDWREVSLETRLSLFVSLLRLHQKAGILHGEIAPRNCVLAPPFARLFTCLRSLDRPLKGDDWS
ncbi:hypothetical protein BJY59DRAFT_326536 [Rhodotorula toruloides]